jgi:hypothetical protein
MNGLTLLIALGAFILGRGFQALLNQANDTTHERKKGN